MGLNKRTYTDQVTVITAENLNEIQDEIIGNSGSLAAEYDNTATYAVDAYCRHGRKQYRCISPITTAEEWTAAHWEEVTIGGELGRKANRSDLGTAASKDVPVSGNASSSQVVLGNDTRLSDARNAADVYSWAKASTKPSYSASEVGAIPSTEKGAASGVAELDANGKVPSSQLPSYVDDIIEGYLYNGAFYSDSAHTTLITGETGKIYVDLTTEKTYRWSGSAYAEISESLALGETSSTAFRGDQGKTAYDDSQANKANIGTMSNLTTTEKGSLVGAVNELNAGKAAAGAAVPAGGTTGQVLKKKSNTDLDVEWATETSGGVQSDWDQTDNTQLDFIKNKPTIPDVSGKANLTVIAGVESSSTASKGYAVGEHLVLSGILYRVTSAISQGDTITDTGNNANVTSKTVGEELERIASGVDALVQESAFSIVIEDGEYVLYWYGAAGECPYSIAIENGEYVLYYNYTT